MGLSHVIRNRINTSFKRRPSLINAPISLQRSRYLCRHAEALRDDTNNSCVGDYAPMNVPQNKSMNARVFSREGSFIWSTPQCAKIEVFCTSKIESKIPQLTAAIFGR